MAPSPIHECSWKSWPRPDQPLLFLGHKQASPALNLQNLEILLCSPLVRSLTFILGTWEFHSSPTHSILRLPPPSSIPPSFFYSSIPPFLSPLPSPLSPPSLSPPSSSRSCVILSALPRIERYLASPSTNPYPLTTHSASLSFSSHPCPRFPILSSI